jgi:hypothetical protein
MPSGKRIVQTYEELAALTEQRGDSQMRDRFLILAADAALAAGQRDDAERLRSRLLEINPHHLLRPYPSFRDALKSPDVASYLADLRDTFTPEESFRLLEKLRADAGVAAPASPPEPAEPEADPEVEAPQIYRFSEEEVAAPRTFDVPLVAPPPEKPAATKARSSQRATPPPEPPVAPLVEAPDVYPYPAETPVPRKRRRREVDADEPPSGVSVAVSSTLFGLVLLAGLALLVYTFARPFVTF